jgi:hypothetical protein
MSFKFTSAATSGADGPETEASQQLGTKLFTTDGKIAIYTRASVAIAANTAALVLADGTAAIKGTGIAVQSDYAIPAGQFGYVAYTFPVKTVS